MSSRSLVCSHTFLNLLLIFSSTFFIYCIIPLCGSFFYIFCFFVEVLTVFIYSSPKFSEHLYNFLFKQFYWNILIVNLQCCTNSAIWQSDSVIYSFSHSFPLWFITYIEYSYLCCGVGPCFHPVCNSLHLLILNSQPFLPSPNPLGKHRSVLYVCESVS